MNLRRIVSSLAAHGGLLLALVAATPSHAASGDDGERARIASERAAIQSRYAARERECRERFVVTSCVDDAKRERRTGLDALKARQLKLDEARRRTRTEERRAELAAKAADDARRERSGRAGAASAPAAREEGAARSAEPRHGGAASGVPHLGSLRDHPGTGIGPKVGAARTESAELRQAREGRSRATFAARQREAAEHREDVLEKTVKKMKDHHPAASLPVPASAPPR